MDDTTACNMSLGHIGADTISGDLLTSKHKNAEHCKTYFETARDATLEAFDWNFARVRQSLALLSDAAPSDWLYAYAYPSDCVAFRGFVEANRRTNKPTPFEIALKPDGSTKYILTDKPDAVGIYTSRVTNLNLWDLLAIEAFSWKLSSLIVSPITRKIDSVQGLERMFQIKISLAQAKNANEARKDEMPESTFVEARA